MAIALTTPLEVFIKRHVRGTLQSSPKESLSQHLTLTLLDPSSFTEKWIPPVIISHRYKAQDTPARRTFEQALTGAFMSAVIKDLRPSALPFVASLIRHYTMVAVAQQCGKAAANVKQHLSHKFMPGSTTLSHNF